MFLIGKLNDHKDVTTELDTLEADLFLDYGLQSPSGQTNVIVVIWFWEFLYTLQNTLHHHSESFILMQMAVQFGLRTKPHNF